MYDTQDIAPNNGHVEQEHSLRALDPPTTRTAGRDRHAPTVVVGIAKRTTRARVAAVMRDLGCAVGTASNGCRLPDLLADALFDDHASHRPDVIIVDAREYDTSHDRMVGDIPGKGLFSSDARVGSLEAYVCTSCGYFESYVASPGDVPWSDLSGFHWVNAEPTDEPGPYR